MKILELMAKALKIEYNDMKNLFEDGRQAMRMNYYPPCPQPDLVIGLNPHSDAVGLTILLQLNEMEGLKIRKDGMWVPVKALLNSFIVNIEDILEVIYGLGSMPPQISFLCAFFALYILSRINQTYA
jgi:isopenicillin N synthase-like dioxygenase